MIKKVLLSAILISALCLCGCNTQITFGPGSEQESEAGQVSESQNTSVEDAEESGSQSNNTGDVQQVSRYLNASVGKMYDSCYEEVQLMYGNCCVIQLDAPEYSALEEAVAQYNYDSEQRWLTTSEELKTYAREDYAYSVTDGIEFWGPYVSEAEMYITRADNMALSAVTEHYWFGGGAHGMSSYQAVNFDTQTGKKLALEDVIINTSALPDALAIEIIEQYPHLMTATQDMWGMSMEDFLASYLTPQTTDDMTPGFTWTLGYEGVTFYFGAYEIGSYADGNQAVVVTYQEYPELFNKTYFTDVPQDYVVEIPPFYWGEEGFTDLNGDGVMDMITVERNYNPEYDMYESVTITVNGVTCTQEIYNYEVENYLVKANGNTYLYVQRTAENDYQDVYVYHITESSIEHVGDFDGSISDITNSVDFGLNRRFDLLSTTSGEGRCYVGDDGMPVEKGGAYEIVGETIITSTVAITAELVDENGNLLGESKTFPAGTEFTFEKTDGMTYVDMKTSEGPLCRLYTSPQWPPTVNNMDAESSFVMLWYAG